MKFQLPTLKQFCITKINVQLWNAPDVVDKMTTHFRHQVQYPWRDIETFVKYRSLHLSLPLLLENQLRNQISFVGNEIKRWFRTYYGVETEYDQLLPHLLLKRAFMIKYMTKLQWTSLGNIDIHKMAEFWVKDQDLTIERRFAIACNFNLTEDIAYIWRHELRQIWLKNGDLAAIRKWKPLLANYWIHCLEGEMEELDKYVTKDNPSTTMHKEMFLEVARDGFEPAMEYFYEKLIDEHQKMCLLRLHYNKPIIMNDIELFKFLYKRLSTEKLVQFTRKHYNSLYKSVSRWPYFDCLWDVVINGMEDMSDGQFYSVLLLSIVSWRRNRHYQDGASYFKYLWKHSKNRRRDFIFSRPNRLLNFLSLLIGTRRPDIVRIVLNDILDWQKDCTTSIFIDCFKLFEPIIMHEQWDLIGDYFKVFTPTLCAMLESFMDLDFQVLNSTELTVRRKWIMRGRSKFEMNVKVMYLKDDYTNCTHAFHTIHQVYKMYENAILSRARLTHSAQI